MNEPLYCLGTGGYHPSEMRHTSCYMLPQSGLILDAGTGMFRVRDLLQTETLDILLSHVHLDHCVGLTYLLDMLWEKPVHTVRIHARPQDLQVIESSLFSSPLFPVSCDYELMPIDGDVEVGPWTVRTRLQEHPGGSLGFVLSKSQYRFAYITDTSANSEDSESVAFLRESDLLIHECYFGNEYAELAEKTGHSYADAVGKLARKADIGQLLLSHVNPLASPAQQQEMLRQVQIHFPKAELATDQQVFDLQRTDRP